MFERNYTQVLQVTRRPEDREPIACEPLPLQPVTPSLRLAVDLLRDRAPRLELEILDQLRMEFDGLDEGDGAQALPSWDRRDVARWREERDALNAASGALEPAPITPGSVLKALFKLPSLWLAEVRRG